MVLQRPCPRAFGLIRPAGLLPPPPPVGPPPCAPPPVAASARSCARDASASLHGGVPRSRRVNVTPRSRAPGVRAPPTPAPSARLPYAPEPRPRPPPPPALGAPPGEESFPPPAPSPRGGSSAYQGASFFSPQQIEGIEAPWPAEDPADPPLSDSAESSHGGSPRLLDLGREAEAILRHYLGEYYAPPAHAEGAQPPPRFFREAAQAPGGIALSSDFCSEFLRINSESPLRPCPPSLARAFPFRIEDSNRFFSSTKHSPDLVAFGNPSGRGGNALRGKEYLALDRHWRSAEEMARASMRVGAYAAALQDLLLRADELEVSQEDCAIISEIIMALLEVQFGQAARIATLATRQRRRVALEALNLRFPGDSREFASIPATGPFLFAGQLTSAFDRELEAKKRASDAYQKLAVRPRPPRSAAAPRRAPGAFRPTENQRSSSFRSRFRSRASAGKSRFNPRSARGSRSGAAASRPSRVPPPAPAAPSRQ